MYCLLEISLITIQTYIWSFFICCPQHSSPVANSPLQISRCRFPVADSPIASALAQFAIVLAFAQVCPCAFASVSALCKLHCMILPAIHPWCKLHRTTLPAIHLWSNIIARLCLQSTHGQTLSHGFARALLLVKGHCTIYFWPFGESFLTLWWVTFDQPVIARLAPDRSALCPSLPPTFSYTLSFIFLRWVFCFALEVVVIGDQLTSLKAAPFTSFHQ